MQPETILQSNLLDIVFENRNKEYGAYELRSHYERRLRRALLTVLGLIAAASLLLLLIGKAPGTMGLGAYKPPINDSLIVSVVNLLPHEVKTSAPAVRIKIPSRPNTLAVPVIVKQQPDIKPIATVSELDKIDLSVTGTPTGNSAKGIEGVGNAGAGTTGSGSAEKAEGTEILNSADVMPEFPGGLEALKRFLGKNLRMPSEDQAPETQVKVVAHFVVDKDGSISAVELMQSGGKVYDNEVKRVLAKMPHWKPGMQHGRPVAVYFYLPVVFQSVADQ